MLSEETMERLAEVLVDRIEELNATILQEIGKTIKKIGTLTPSKAYQLEQILRYGGSYEKIARKIAEVTELNVEQIYEIFEEVAKKNQLFAKKFYDYRGVDFIPYDENEALKQKVRGMVRLTAEKYINLSNNSAFAIFENGVKTMTPLSQVYQKVVDKAIMSISMGLEDYNTTMRKTMREMAKNGIRTVEHASGYSRRLDSSVRMNILDGIREMSNEIQTEFGKQFDADGVEITVHLNPAPDHENAQGHQFSYEEYDKLQKGLEATDYKDRKITLGHDGNNQYRPISTMNCYHGKFDIVLGVSDPQYSQEQLNEINKKNKEGFDFEGEHYTMYEGTQLQRRIETKIRQLKDEHIGLVSLGDEDSMLEAGNIQSKIRVLNKRYKQLSDASGLPTKKQRMTVSGYKRINTKKY